MAMRKYAEIEVGLGFNVETRVRNPGPVTPQLLSRKSETPNLADQISVHNGITWRFVGFFSGAYK